MNKIKQLSLSALIVLMIFGCGESIDYKYSEKPMIVSCDGADQELINEAIYSFFSDISSYYTKQMSRQHRPVSSAEAYASFVYPGSKGEVDFKAIASAHSLKILEELKKEKQLWVQGSDASNLNYDSKFISCLHENIEDPSMKATIKALKETGSLSPKLLSERLLTNTTEALNNPNFVAYIVLDIYYQYLLDIDIPKVSSNE